MRRIQVDRLRAGMVVEEDIYADSNPLVPLIRKDTVLNRPLLFRLSRHGVKSIFVKTDTESSRSSVTTATDIFVTKPPPVIDDLLKEDAIESLETLFDTISVTEEDVHASSLVIVRHLDGVVEQLVNSLEEDRGTLVNINDIKSYDEYTYHHSLSVAILCIAIGQYLGMSMVTLNLLGKTAIMHDIGKTAVPIEIIQKPGRLSNEEFDAVKIHPVAGYEYLRTRAIGTPNTWEGVLHHHEKFDGTGYPKGLRAGQIPFWSRIIAVADVYDALTSNRPYRQPMQPAEAIEYIMGGAGSVFDYDIVDAFVKKVELYPVGSVIELTSGRWAIVLDNYNHFRPVVRFLDTGEVVDLFHDRSYLSQVIARLVPDGEASQRAIYTA